MSAPIVERATALAPARTRRAVTGVRAESVGRTRALVVAASVVLFLMSLYPRAINLSGYLTTDEGNWMGRTALFARALQTGDPAGTYQSGHPGVMTMWLSLIGMGPDHALGLVEYVRPDGLEKAPGYLDTLHLARRSFAVLTALATVGVALLTWRLFGRGPGLLAGVLLGLEPFFLSHSVIAHVDSNVTTWMTVCILSAIIYFWAGGGLGFLMVSGLAAGLAFLSKAPSAFLPLFVPIVALTSLAIGRRYTTGAAWVRLVRDGLLWGALAFLAAVVLWPSFRADPIGTLYQMVDYTEAVGGSDHENFFLGQPVGDPGPLYYLVALGFRLTPVTMAGLLLLVVGLIPLGRWRPPAGWTARIGLLVTFCVLFILMMAMAPKKFDRYLLPIFPTLEVLAAVGFWLALWRLPGRVGVRLLPATLLAIGLLQILPAVRVFPYYLAYYNPLLGGGPAARRAFVVGWGEGLDVITDYLNQKPNSERLTVAGFYPRVMSAQFKGTVLSDKQFDPALADYVVLYVNAMQRDLANRLRAVTRGKKTELVVRINGIEYARLYAVPPPPRRDPAGTEYGGQVRLERSYMKSDERPYLKSDNLNPGDTIELTVRWSIVHPPSEDLMAVVQLQDKRGTVIAEDAAPVGGDGSRTSAMRAGEIAIESHRIELPSSIDSYNVAIGVRRPNGEWVDVTSYPERLTDEARQPPNQVVVESIDAQ
ncbi:MAG: hypothetical protein IT305_27400 [Chloroflexi bacterium]|nr:hypothetical protein [Chloroflexota bacterium]